MLNFNNAEPQNSFDLIPVNTIAKARLVIKPGNDATDTFITRSKGGDTAYLNCEFIILEGKYTKRKVFDKIGLEGSDKWVNMGKARSDSWPKVRKMFLKSLWLPEKLIHSMS